MITYSSPLHSFFQDAHKDFIKVETTYKISQERKKNLEFSETTTSSSPFLLRRQSKIFYKKSNHKQHYSRKNNLTLSGTITSSSPFLLRRQSKRFYKNCTHNESHKNSIPHLTGFLLK